MEIIHAKPNLFLIKMRTGSYLQSTTSNQPRRFHTREEAQKYIDQHPYCDIWEEEVEELLDDEEVWI